MGLMDILNGMQNGPRGNRPPAAGKTGGGGMSPMMIALIGLLAYKAFKGRGGQAAAPGPALPPGGNTTAGLPGGLGDILGGLLGGKPGGTSGAPKTGGGLADLIPGGLGGLLGGAAAGSVLSGGLGNLIKEFQDHGQGKTADSWVGSGPNHEIAPKDLAGAIGNDALDALSKQLGIGRDELLAGLSQHLPELVNQLTPNGRLPSTEEASRMV
jgi:uncharacterized protein YidB (DUF937 family)